MTFQAICRGLAGIPKLYGGVIVEQNLRVIPPGLISWNGYTPGIDARGAYRTEHQTLINGQQYSFLLESTDFFQFYFQFEGAGGPSALSHARLAYYPRPGRTPSSDNEALEPDQNDGNGVSNEDLLDVPEPASGPNQSHVRIDYDANTAAHAKCHLQFGAFEAIRLPFKVVLNPLHFFDFVMSQVHPSAAAEARRKSSYAALFAYSQRRYLRDASFNEPHIFVDIV